MRQSEFEWINRGFEDTLLLIPGWATDHRIFDTLDLDFNYLLPVQLSPDDFKSALDQTLSKMALDKISIFGWSLGGYLAADFASNYAERVKDITFVGMRKKYDGQGLENVKRFIRRNKAAYLHKFYNECFTDEEMKKRYLESRGLDELIDGLDYLGRAELDSAKLKNIDVRFIHGECDKIAPIEGLNELKDDFSAAEFIIVSGALHAPFLRNDFRDVFYGK